MPVTEILFGDTDGSRVSKTTAGPVVPISIAGPGAEGVTLIGFASGGLIMGELVAGISGVFTGFFSGVIGSVTPTQINGANIHLMGSDSGSGNSGLWLAGVLTQDYFTTFMLDGNTLETVDAGFVTAGGFSIWTWPGLILLASGTYEWGYA